MRRRLLVLALALPVAGGCATKKDLRQLRTEVEALRTSQEATQQALLQELRQQQALLLDSLSAKDVRLRGDLMNRMVALERQLVTVQELSGQSQQGLAVLRQELRQREEALRAATAAPGEGALPAGPAAGNPDELFTSAQAALQRGSFTTARAGFEEFVRSFPQHARAAEAQLAVGESYEKAGEPQRALDAYQRVLELYPSSTRAPTALFRSAQIEQERGNRDKSRLMLNQLITAYPRSPEATRAREQLNQRPRR